MISLSRRTTILVSIVLAHTLAACGDRGLTEYRLSGPTMGTQFNVAIAAEADFPGENLQREIHAALENIDATMSTFRTQSDVARFNRSTTTDWVSVSPQLCDAVARSLKTSALTGGAFDITVGPLVNLWGFGPGESRHEPPASGEIDAARSITGFDKLHADCERPAIRKDHANLHIDLSAYAKGLAADNIASLLDDSGIQNYLVEIGGDLRASGFNADRLPWRIAIENPDANGRPIEMVIDLSDGAVATSGDYRNFFEANGRRYSHTIDPGTGRPVAHQLASVTVRSGNAADADMLATALMVLGPDDGLAFADREGIAAYLLIREEHGMSERSSRQFRSLAAR